MNETNTQNLADSYHLILFLNKIKTIAFLIVFLIGLIGNSLTIFVFGQKRFRININNVYLLCLSLNDSFYLIIHFFEDTIINMNRTFSIINENEFFCKLTQYFRYVLRFTSAFIIVAFTIQRLLVIYSPVKNRFKSTRIAWNVVIKIILASFTFNSWVPFLFRVTRKEEKNMNYCDINEEFSEIYLIINFIYICLVMFLPIAILFICNLCIIVIIIMKHKQSRLEESMELINLNRDRSNSIVKKKNSMKMTRMLLIISFSYAFLNLPYFVFW